MHNTRSRSAKLTRLGERGLLVFLENRITPATNNRVHTLRKLLENNAPNGIVDLVPAYSSLLVIFDHDTLSHEALEDVILDLLDNSSEGGVTEQAETKSHVVPVQYGGEAGPDLADVAQLHWLTTNDIVKLHTSRDYKVNFLGFLPGFGYLGKLHNGLVTTRLATPRTRIAAGSVGIAGAQTAVYPFASPGGWRLLGRTSIPVWDPFSASPARFAPGDTVQFVRSAYEPPISHGDLEVMQPARPLFEVASAPGLTTVQDLGRQGLAHLGVTQGGVFDRVAATRANALVGNDSDKALLEMTWNGPTLLALRNATVALDGADLECRVDGAPVPPGLSWFVRRGSTLRFSRTRPGHGGVRGYLAVAGGIDVPLVLNSRSTSLQAHFGGYSGRALRVGDVLGVGEADADIGLFAGRYWLGPTLILPEQQCVLRYVSYRGRCEVSSAARREFNASGFLLTDSADRMGYRFRSEDGTSLVVTGGELISFGVVRGAIQLPPDGNPVVLNVDHQTTGGYPLLGVVIEVDWPALAQLVPGTKVRFQEISMAEAYAQGRKAASDLTKGLGLLRS